MKRLRYIPLWIVLAASLVLAGRQLAVRVPFEEANRSVELALEYGDLQKIAASCQMETLQLVAEAQSWGMTTLVLLDEDALAPNADLLAYAKSNDLMLMPQLSNTLLSKGYTDVQSVLYSALLLPNSSKLFFSGYEVYGWGNEDTMTAAARILAMAGHPLGIVEFLGKQEGLDYYLAANRYQAIRIHPGYPYDTREELLLAVTDRSVRLLFLKPYKHMDMTAGNELASLRQWITQTRTDLLANDYTPGKAASLPAVGVGFQPFLSMAAGILAAAALLFAAWFPRVPEPLLYAFALSALLLLSLCYSRLWISGYLLLEGMALLAAIVFPTLGLTLYQKFLRQWHNGPPPGRAVQLKTALVGMLAVTALTFSGAVLGNALLSENAYLLAARSFRGVKLAYLLPLVLTAAYWLWQQTEHGQQLNRLKERLTWKTLAGGILALAGIGFYILRSGNETGAVSGFELWLRQALDRFFGVRPRFKEFLTGYPALLILPLLSGQPVWSFLALLLAAAGQVSVFNTYMHLHTPFLLSLQRTGWGLFLGSLLGLLALLALTWILAKSKPKENKSQSETGPDAKSNTARKGTDQHAEL
ncbi:MAG: DUF5693 family protein [Negativicutes bacterium]|nr:DUF5693 family protein [Negativicutes bacterium]